MARVTAAAGILGTVVFLTLVGCESTPGPSTQSPSPATATVVPADAAELEAQRFRRDFGLRSDLQWVRAVAADPSADRLTFGVPLTADEVAELNRRSATMEEIKAAVLPYALSQPEYAGAWIDHDRGGVLVVQFAGSTLGHQVEVLSRVRPGAPIEVRAVRWSLSQLDDFSGRLVGEDEWFATIPAYLTGFGPDVVLNRLSIEISSADPLAAEKIEAHFGWTDDIVIVDSDGTGILLLEPGRLSVRAVDEGGRPVAGLACVMISDVPNATEPRPLPMPTTDTEGLCERDVAPTGYTIQLETGQAPPTVVATARATVRPRELTEVTVVVP